MNKRVRPDLTARNRQQHKGRFLYEDADWMRAAYVDQQMSLRQMAKQAECALRTVARWMDIHQISRRDSVTAMGLTDRSGANSVHWRGGRPRCVCGKTISWRSTWCNTCRPRSGELHPNWVGSRIRYAGAHDRVKRERGPALQYSCACGSQAQEWAYDGADPDEVFEGVLAFSLKAEHYKPMCCGCHRRMDAARRRAELTAYRSRETA